MLLTPSKPVSQELSGLTLLTKGQMAGPQNVVSTCPLPLDTFCFPCHWTGLEPTPELEHWENSQMGLAISDLQPPLPGRWRKLTLRQPGALGKQAPDLPGLPETGPTARVASPVPSHQQASQRQAPGGATAAQELIGCPQKGHRSLPPACKLPLVSCTWQRGSQLPGPHPP